MEARISLHNKEEFITIPIFEGSKEWESKVNDKLLKLPKATPSTKGISLIVGGWFYKSYFTGPIIIDFVYDRLIEKDKGPLVEDVGHLIYSKKDTELANKLLYPLIDLLSKLDFIGPVGVEILATKEALYFKSFKCFSLQTTSELLKPNLQIFWQKLKEGCKLIERKDYILGCSIGVGITLVYPTVKEDHLAINDGARKHFWLHNSLMGIMTASGENIKEAQRRVYRSIYNVVINQEVQYRSDIGYKTYEDADDIDRWYNANLRQSSKEGNIREDLQRGS